MAIDVASFKAEFPEFVDAPDPLVQAQLHRAEELVPPRVWDDEGLTEHGVFLYTARFLALSPYARKLGLVNDQGETNYDARLLQLRSMVTSGFRVL